MTGRSLEKVESAMSEIKASSIKGKLSALQLDVTDECSIDLAAKYVQEQCGQLDVLVNNAAVGGTVDPNIKTRMQLCMETNVVGAAVVANAFRPLLLKAQNSYSTFVSSGAGSLTRATAGPASMPNEDAYRASKAAPNMIAVVEARDFGPKGLKVFAMSPGFVVSNLRGTTEDLRTGWGKTGDPIVSGQTILSIMEGERDADVGKLMHKDGVYPW